MSILSPNELKRYDRHIILPEVGLKGQERLKNSSVLLVGAGGLGSPLAMYLAAAGVGRIGIVDFDIVDESNLQRQIIHGQSTIGQKKLDSAKKRLLDINPNTEVICHFEPLLSDNALKVIEPYDLVADGTDNFPTRYLVNDACVLSGKANVYGSIFRFEGQISVFNYKGGPCYRCLFSEPPPPGLVPSCAEGGVFGVLPGVVGCLQATEVIKVLLEIGDIASERLLIFDALTMKFRQLKLRKNKDCILCGENPSVKELIDYEIFCGMPSRNKDMSGNMNNQSTIANPNEISPENLKKYIEKNSNGELNILDVREVYETEISKIEDSVLIPLGDLEQRYQELDASKEWIVYCKSGGRSGRAMEFLQSKGYNKIKNLVGGINDYAKKVDANLSTY